MAKNSLQQLVKLRRKERKLLENMLILLKLSETSWTQLTNTLGVKFVIPYLLVFSLDSYD
jgi:hypothetical protein